MSKVMKPYEKRAGPEVFGSLVNIGVLSYRQIDQMQLTEDILGSRWTACFCQLGEQSRTQNGT
jgi:hypothetical protein